jgi:quinol monooxygenase YgiN
MIACLTIVRYPKRYILLALFAMAIHRITMRKQKGCTFFKLLGSGKNGTFNLTPDWQQWGLLSVWRNQADAELFYQSSAITNWWNRFTNERWNIFLEPLQSHGKWDNKEVFGKIEPIDYKGPIAVLTQATIRLKRLKNFWSNVEGVTQLMKKSSGFITSLGIGEAPFYKQATFSVWKDIESVKAFAYLSKEHADVIRKTREEAWYSEELFARFRPIKAWGTLQGSDPLKGLIKFEDI